MLVFSHRFGRNTSARAQIPRPLVVGMSSGADNFIVRRKRNID